MSFYKEKEVNKNREEKPKEGNKNSRVEVSWIQTRRKEDENE